MIRHFMFGIGVLLASVGQAALQAAAGQPCVVAFDGNLDTSSGQGPLAAEGVSFAPGKSGQAGVFGPQSRLAYPAAGNYSPESGTVEMWVKRQWPPLKSATERMFWFVPGDQGHTNLAKISFHGMGSFGELRFSLASAGSHSALQVPVLWKKDTWRHVRASWDKQRGYRALYLDGELQAAVAYRGDMPGSAEAFHVGHGPDDGGGALVTIDDFAIRTTVDPAETPPCVRAVEARAKAAADRAALVKRLGETYSPDRVEKEQIEVRWEDVSGLPTALTKRVPIQACHHPDLVQVHPDLSITVGGGDASLVLGFALGDDGKLPDMYQVARRLRHGCQPIVESRWAAGDVVLDETAFCTLPNDDDVASGNETQYAFVRVKVANHGRQDLDTSLLLMIGKSLATQRALYEPFVPGAARWQEKTLTWKLDGQSLVAGQRVFLCYRQDGSEPASFHPVFDLHPVNKGGLEEFRNCLRFPLRLKPNESRTIDLVTAGTSTPYPIAARDEMAAQDYDRALQRAEAHWDGLLARGMRLATPDPKVNEIYQAMILSSLQNLRKNRDYPWHEPIQSCSCAQVWTWEFSQQAVPLASVGYHQELEPSLAFFTQRQPGVGPHAVDRGPEGQVDSIHGCYVGNAVYWMSETGAALNAMAGKCLYSRDHDWLQQNRPSILAAWQFIQKARDQTRITAKDGQKDIAYGLLPPGRATDFAGGQQVIGFNDAFTWEGMTHMAEAFRAARLPEADRMTKDAEEYRACIVEAARRSQYTDPETGLVLIAGELSGPKPGDRFPIRRSLNLWQTGLLDVRDPRFDAAIDWQRRCKGGFLMGLCFPFPPGSSLWYVNSLEKGKFMNHLARGEFERALLIFYTNLVYSMSQDCYQTVERINFEQPNYSPFQQNASGNGRVIEMCRRMVIDEQEPGVLWLLRGCPRRWFAPGKEIVVENAPTFFGPMAVRTRADGRTIRIDIDSPSWEPPRELRVVVRHPDRRQLTAATVDGKKCACEQETVTIPAPRGRLHLVCSYE